MIQRIAGATTGNYYLWHDQLGSLVRMTDALGAVTDSLDFAAFGERRAAANPQAAGSGPNSNLTRRGFTGHEQFAGLNIIHMNGRIYDPSLGRFMQADPLIQGPANAQSWNAYTYVFNNPLAYTDPTGMSAWRQVLGVAIAIVGAYVSFVTAGGDGGTLMKIGIAMAFGAASGYVATGTLRGGVTGAFTAALTAGVAIGVQNWDTLAQIGAQAVTGGIVESLQGGNFGNGFAAAGLTAAVMPQVGRIDNDVARTTVGALAGGTISELTGGKFANGAISGAVQAAMAGRFDSEIYGAGGGTSNSARALAIEKTTLVEDMYSKSGQSLNDFEGDVSSRLQVLTEANGDEHAAGFSFRDIKGKDGVVTRSHAARIQTSGSPVISAVVYRIETDGWTDMQGKTMHTHGFFMPRETFSKLDAAYLGRDFSEGQRLFGADLRRVNSMIVRDRPSNLDLELPSGSLSTSRGIVRWPK